MRTDSLFAKWKRQYADDPEYITYELLYAITDDICRVMQECSMSYDDLAKLAGCSRRHVVKFLNTPRKTSLEDIVRFSNAVGLDVLMSLESRSGDNEQVQEG